MGKVLENTHRIYIIEFINTKPTHSTYYFTDVGFASTIFLDHRRYCIVQIVGNSLNMEVIQIFRTNM